MIAIAVESTGHRPDPRAVRPKLANAQVTETVMSVPIYAIDCLLAFVAHVGKDTARPRTRSTCEQKG